MPIGVRIFLVYAFVILALIGVTLPLVVAQAIESPISFPGLVDMLLLAYLIFTVTLVLQRKQAGYPLALGLASLGITLVPLAYLSPAGLPGAIVALILVVVVLGSLRRRASRSWFAEP
jgi:hypothetical protein